MNLKMSNYWYNTTHKEFYSNLLSPRKGVEFFKLLLLDIDIKK